MYGYFICNWELIKFALLTKLSLLTSNNFIYTQLLNDNYSAAYTFVWNYDEQGH